MFGSMATVTKKALNLKPILLVTILLWKAESTWLLKWTSPYRYSAIVLETAKSSEHDGCYKSVTNALTIMGKRTNLLLHCFFSLSMYLIFSFVSYEGRSFKTREDSGYLATRKTQFYISIRKRSKNFTLNPWSVSFPLQGGSYTHQS